jgi:hypothetical protein
LVVFRHFLTYHTGPTMPPPVEPADTCTASRAQIALYYLGRARRRLLDAKLYLLGTPAGRNFDGLISALESRIDRIRLHGLGEIDTIAAAPADGPDGIQPDAPLIAIGVDGGTSTVTSDEVSF